MAISFVIMVFFLSFRNEPKRWRGSMTFTDSIGNPDHAVKGSSTYLPNAKARSATASAATDDNADDNADDDADGNHNRKNRSNAQWERKYAELVAYHTQNGHANVPRRTVIRHWGVG